MTKVGFSCLGYRRSRSEVAARTGVMLLALVASPALAATISDPPYGNETAPALWNFIENYSAAPWLGIVNANVAIGVGGNFVPNPPGGAISFAAEQSFASQTSVSATQGNTTYALRYFDSPALPFQWWQNIPYSSALTGSWNISVTNAALGTYTFTTNSIPANTPILPLPTNVQTSSKSTGAILSWTQPSFFIPTGYAADEQLYVMSNSGNSYIDAVFPLPINTASSFDLSNLPTRLSPGDSYTLLVEANLFDANGVELSTSQTFFLFNPTSAVPEPSTWAMLVLGFVGLGYLGYRRKMAVVTTRT